eukprot:gene19923-biopygen8515
MIIIQGHRFGSLPGPAASAMRGGAKRPQRRFVGGAATADTCMPGIALPSVPGGVSPGARQREPPRRPPSCHSPKRKEASSAGSLRALHLQELPPRSPAGRSWQQENVAHTRKGLRG